MTGAQLPITNTLDVAGSCNISGDCNITGALSLNSFSIGSGISFTNLTQTRIICKKSLVLGQAGDTNGSSYLTLQNRQRLNGALFQTTDPTTTLVDFAFLTGNAVQRYIRLEGRVASAKCGAPTLHIGGTGPDSPCLAVGDTHSAITKLAVGSYTSPGNNALSVTGTVSLPG